MSNLTETPIAHPLSKLFSNMVEANEVLDIFKYVISLLQDGGDEKHGSLTTSIPEKLKIGLNFGQWAVLRYNPNRKWRAVVPIDDPNNAEHIFNKTLDGKSYGLQWMEYDELFEEGIQEKFFEGIEAAKKLGGKTNSSSLNTHNIALYDAIITPEKREQFLIGGNKIDAHAKSTSKVWIIAPGENANQWEDFLQTSEMGIGWIQVGDLSEVDSKEQIEELVSKYCPSSKPKPTGKALYDFSRVMHPGDYVLAKNGRKQLLGWGVIRSDYRFNPSHPKYHHRRSVEWKPGHATEVPIEEKILPMKTLTMKKLDNSLMQYLTREHGYFDGLKTESTNQMQELQVNSYTKEDALEDLFVSSDRLDQMMQLLKRRKNIILQGAPGTGKTFIARRLAYLLMEERDKERAPLVQFHQNTSYEDFIQGFRPSEDGSFHLRNGIFYEFCEKARAEPDKPYVFIIDEINRGNLSKIFGELMMLIESDKREDSYALQLSYTEAEDSLFFVPANIHLIGTMNTADRSLSFVDYALRRRFAFLEMEPGFDSPVFETTLTKNGISKNVINRIRSVMGSLNEQIETDTANLGRGYRIGHSFFVPTENIPKDDAWFNDVIKYDIIPLLEEYWMDDLRSLETALAILE